MDVGNQVNPPASARTVEYQSNSGDWAQIVRIAKAQKLLLWVILLTLVSLVPMLMMMGMAATTPRYIQILVAIGAIVLALAAFAARIWAIIVLLRALGSSVGAIVAWIVGMTAGSVVPLLALILLLIINQMATSRLQKAGLKVGLMGARLPCGQA